MGNGLRAELGPPVDVAQKVRDALAADAAWRHVLPAADAGTAQLRSWGGCLAPAWAPPPDQTEAPLDVQLAKFGASAVTSADRVTVRSPRPAASDHGAGIVRDFAVLRAER